MMPEKIIGSRRRAATGAQKVSMVTFGAIRFLEILGTLRTIGPNSPFFR
jgi:hypothetical protein